MRRCIVTLNMPVASIRHLPFLALEDSNLNWGATPGERPLDQSACNLNPIYNNLYDKQCISCYSSQEGSSKPYLLLNPLPFTTLRVIPSTFKKSLSKLVSLVKPFCRLIVTLFLFNPVSVKHCRRDSHQYVVLYTK